ncbi:MAG: hypothetical protein P4M11_09355 [Candidatus Pacebacteria bacterium]|nr:hypothetical protein [Candidatus Paceibacterota bacterium]
MAAKEYLRLHNKATPRAPVFSKQHGRIASGHKQRRSEASLILERVPEGKPKAGDVAKLFPPSPLFLNASHDEAMFMRKLNKQHEMIKEEHRHIGDIAEGVSRSITRVVQHVLMRKGYLAKL